MKFNQTYIAVATVMLGLAGCSKEAFVEQDAAQSQEPLTKVELNAIIKNEIETKNDVFHWQDQSDQVLWSAAVQSDSIMSIGYQPAGYTQIEEKIHLIDINESEWANIKNKLLTFIVQETNRLNPSQKVDAADILLPEPDGVLPHFMVKMHNQEVISQLRSMPEVRFVEPLGYEMESEIQERSDAGCGLSPNNNIPSADYTTTSPSAKIPWNFYNMNIPAAWATSTGDNIEVTLIDTGVYPEQSKLGSAFNSGQSQGRSIGKTGTYNSSFWWWNTKPDGPNDKCGHGTQMAGLIAAPRGSGGSSVGVAYNCNLYSIRGTGDVVVNGSKEKTGVKNALVKAGKRGSTKIISMSIGDIFYSSTVADGIYYAYNRGKMIFAAAGTSTSFTNWVGVVFPATMSQTVAVTGVKDGSSLSRCNTCHSGSAVDFVAVMQRSSSNSRTSLTLARSGNTPSSVGGSSAATATTAGIAALVWATNTSQSRSQVLSRLKNAASIYPSRNSQYGWGIIDAAQAVN
ncbi:MAG: S8 family serine peptidase [Saprospiraceae bacterium]|nr:S8 family serine peptidase [Saprospiraceae bacterium]